MKTFPTNKHMNYAHTSIDKKIYIYYISVPIVVAAFVVIPVVP